MKTPRPHIYIYVLAKVILMFRHIDAHRFFLVGGLLLGSLAIHESSFATEKIIGAVDVVGERKGQLDEDYKHDLQRIIEAGTSKDLNRLETVADEIQKTWSNQDQDRYFALISIVVQQFMSHDFAGPDRERRFDLGHWYAKLALQKVDKMPLEDEILFLSYLMTVPGFASGNVHSENWAQDRRDMTTLVFHPLRIMDQTIDRHFDFSKNVPLLSVAPPPGIPGFSGMAPGSIKDVEKRHQYETAIAENTKNSSQYRTQRRLLELEREYLPRLDRYLSVVYSMKPYNTEELKSLLREHSIPTDRTTTILRMVEQSILSDSQGQQGEMPVSALENAENR